MRIKIRYYIGTSERIGYATTYRGAMRIGGRTQNVSGPWYYDEEDKSLYDDGNGLAYGDEGDVRMYAVLK